MENLTKENFFNEMQKKYPKAMDIFCKWIDEYKKRVEWDCPLKYHDLPLAMQAGIWSVFILENEVRNNLSLYFDTDMFVNAKLLKGHIKEWMSNKDFQNI
jgi:hypothetical protein